ncbi:MAG: BTAD domain-containing putative transcriptional regulator [Actinomycetes bacterium]
MGIAVLGPLEVDGRMNGLSPRDRVVLSALVVGRGDPVSVDALADALWGEHPPASSVKLVQGCVVRLRKLLGAAAIDSGSSGYRLTLTDEEVDHRRFERLLERARDALDGDPARASYLVLEALDLWRGRALVDLGEWEVGRVEATRLEGLRMEAEELLVAAELGGGHAQAVLEQARTMVAQAPFRERRWVLLATALHQAGRQADALGAVKRARRMLAEELGIDPGRELGDLEELLLRQDPSLRPAEARTVSASCPYRGLLPYGSEDADSFFGRGDDAAACLRRLRDVRVLAVVGPSGIGKSSLVLAGVVAALIRAGTPVFVTTPGVHPVDSLSGLKPRGRQTLVVDQVEEAVTVCSEPAERERYFAALAAHVGAGGALVLSLRADHLGDLAPYPDIARVLEDGLYLLGPMGEADLRSAIEGPARRAGLRLEPGLVDLLVREVEGEPAALPLLSHVLRETWERREGPTLTVASYRATGGIRHAVAKSAESLYDAMDDAQRGRLRSLLLRLVMPNEDGDAIRARVPRAKVAVDEAHVRLVEQLVDARLVSIDGDTVQIAHEALFRVWPRLRGWLDDDVEGQRLFRHLAGAADAWHAMDRPESELYRGMRLTRTLEWRARARPDLSAVETVFLDASAALSESEQRAAQARVRRERRVNHRLRGALSGVAVLAVVSVVAGGLAVRSSDRAEDDRDRARSAADLADARRAGAVALEHEDLSVSLLLALAALQVDSSAAARDNLTAVLMRSPSLLSYRGPNAFFVDLTASPDGALLAASRPTEGEGVLLIDAATFKPLPFADDIPASGIAFSPDSSLLAMAVNHWTGNDGSPPRIDDQPVRLYDTSDGTLADRQLGGFPDGGSVEYALDFSADGRRLVAAVDQLDAVTGAAEKTFAMVWNLADPSRPVFRVELPEHPILKLSPDGKRLYVAVTGLDPDRPIRVYDVDSGRLVDSLGSGAFEAIGQLAPGDLSPDGSTLAVPTGSTVRRLDTATMRFVRPALHGDVGDSLDKIEYSHDGSRLAAATGNGNILVWDAASGALLHRFVGGAAWGFDFSADDRTILAAGEYLTSWDLTGERELFAVGRASGLADHTVSKPAPDGRTLVRERLGRMWFVDNQTGRETAKRAKPKPDSHHVWSPDSRWLLSWRDGGTLRLWETATARLVARRRLTGSIVPAFDPSSEQVYVNVIDESILLVLDAANLKPTRAPIELSSPVLGVVPHPDDGSVFAFAHDGAVLRVAPGTGAVAAVAPPGTFPVARTFEADVSHDATRFLGPNLNADDTEVQLVDATTWERLGAAAPRDERPGTFDLSPDGTQFATLHADGIVLFDGTTGARQATISLPSRTPEVRLSYLPESSGLLVAGVDGRTWTVDTRPASWSDRACTIAGRNLSREEWKEYFPGRAYEVTCAQWPAGS